MKIKTIQFKRILTSGKPLDQTISLLKYKLVPKLKEGEPIICSYLDGGKLKYLIAVGLSNDIRVIPTFKDVDEIQEYVSSGSFNLEDISEESDVIVERDESGKLKLKIKDSLTNNWSTL